MNARRRDSKRKNWPANLYQKVDGYFWYKNPETGRTKGLGHDRVKAFDEARAANAVLANKKDSTLVDWVSGISAKTLRECALEYEKAYIAEHTAENTVKQMKSSIRFICAADFADKRVDKVTTQEVAAFIKATELERGPRAAHQRRIALRDIFFQAEADGLIKRGENPVTVTKAPKTTIMRDRLSLEQFLEIRKHADGWLLNAMNLAIVSGQARAEISSAAFADFKDGFWYCNRGKTGAKIRIPLLLRLNAVGLSLEDVLKQCRDRVVSKYLIHQVRTSARAKAGAKIQMDAISKEFAAARERAGIIPQDGKEPPSFHEIRSLAGRLYEKEYGAAFAQKLFGHKSASTTAVYIDARGSDWIDVAVG